MGIGALHWTGYLALSKKGSRPKMAFIYNIDTLHSVTLSSIIYLHRWISPSDLLDDMMRWSLRGWRADGGPLHIRDVGWAKVLTGHHSFGVSAFFWPLWGLIFGVIFWCQLSLYPESQPEESKTTKDEQWQCAVTNFPSAWIRTNLNKTCIPLLLEAKWKPWEVARWPLYAGGRRGNPVGLSGSDGVLEHVTSNFNQQ